MFEKVKQTIKNNLPEIVSDGTISGQSNEMISQVGSLALVNGSKLIVGPSQEAIFVKNGQIENIFGPGKYDLETDNTTLTKILLKKIYDGGDPNQAGIWFVNKSSMMEIPWGTPNPLSMTDNRHGIPLTLNIRCRGAITVRVTDSRALFTNLVGQNGKFTIDSFKDSVRSMLASRLQKVIGYYLSKNPQMSFVTLQQNATVLEKPLKAAIITELMDFGLVVEACYVRSVEVVNDDSWERYKRIEEKYVDIKSKQLDAEMEAYARTMRGTTFAEERQFDILETSASNKGNPISSFSTGVAASSLIMNTFEEKMKPSAPAPAPSPAAAPAPAASEAKTCPNCNTPCPENAKFCIECGYILKKVCSSCGKNLSGEAKFCPECGTKV